MVRLQTPLGQITQYQYDALDDLLKIIDALGSQTNFSYDPNRNLLTIQDARTNTTTYTPDSMDRVGSRKDALLNSETYQYDLNGNPAMFSDRKNGRKSPRSGVPARQPHDPRPVRKPPAAQRQILLLIRMKY